MGLNRAWLLACLAGVVLLRASNISADQIKSVEPIYIRFQIEDFDGAAGDQPQWRPGWLSVSAKPGPAAGELSVDFVVPQRDTYVIWVRYTDHAGKSEPFDIRIDQAAGSVKASFGRSDALEPRRRGYIWNKQPVTLEKGTARLRLVLPAAATVGRSFDAMVITNDAKWLPRDRGFPPFAYSKYLMRWAETRKILPQLLPSQPLSPRASWTMPRLAGRDFWYLGASEFVAGFPSPVHLHGEVSTVPKFVTNYSQSPAGAPIFSSPLCAIKLGIAEVKTLLDTTSPMRKYILAQKVPFVLVGNYNSAGKIPNSYATLKATFGDLWLGMISGEGTYLDLPFYDPTIAVGPEFKQRQYDWLLNQGKAAWSTSLGNDWASQITNPFEKFIFCPSVGTLHNIHRMGEAGCPIVGTESAAAMPYMPQQIAFARGAGRQYDVPWMWYYGASFGAAIRTFTKESPYFIGKVDNRNDVVGPSLAHIRRVLLHTYLQGVGLFFPEQGYNLFGPDGQLNPMGWSYDEMVRLATRHPDRGVTYTPIGLLLDRAHGWEKYGYVGSRIWNKAPLARADRMVDGFFNIAYYPFPRNEGGPVDDLSICWPNGYFGDIFDVLVTSPTRLDAIKKYQVIFCVGDTRLDARWVGALKEFVASGGTLVINTEQVVPELDEQFLGVKLLADSKETSAVVCLPDGERLVSTPFPYRLVATTTGQIIAKAENGDPIAVLHPVGKGRVVLTTPSYLLGRDLAPTPYMARLLLQITANLLPIAVQGNCEHYVNLHPNGYLVVLSHNEGIAKPSHGRAVMYREKTSRVELRIKDKPHKTEDWLGEQPQTWLYPDEWLPEYTQPTQIHWQPSGDGYTAQITLQPGEIRAFLIRTRE